MLQSTMDRDSFIYRYDWKGPCQNQVFLGNGSLGALFDRTGIAVRDYVYRKGIRRSGNLAGCFSLFTQREEHEARGWEQALDMYWGTLTTSFPCSPHPEGNERRSVTSFIHLEKNLLVFHYEPRTHSESKMLGLTFAPREGFPAKITDIRVSRESDSTLTFDLDILSDGNRLEKPDVYSLTNDPFRKVVWKCQLSMGVEGGGTITIENDNGLAVFSGPGTLYVAFSAFPSDIPSTQGASLSTAKQVVADSLQKGFQRVEEEHRAAWEAFWEKTGLSLPEKDLEKIYIASLYYHRVSMGRYTATPSFFPLNAWRSEYMWDDTWMHHAMVSSNQVGLADTVPDHWNRLIEWGRVNLRKREALNKPGDGSCSGSILDYLSLEPEYYIDAPEYRRDGFNLTLSAALSGWRQYTYTGDEGCLRKYYDLMISACEMLVSYGLEPHGEKLWIRRSQTTDESLGNEGCPNSFTNAAMAKALLMNTAAAAYRMGEGKRADEYRRTASKIELANDGSVYLAFAGATEASDDTMLNFFPAMIVEDADMSRRTLDWYERDCFSTMGAACVKAWVADRAVFPWVHFRVVISEAMVERPERVGWLLGQMREHACYQLDWGVLPQIIHRAGYADVPLLTPHASFIQALNLVLLQSEELVIGEGVGGGLKENEEVRWAVKIFPGVPDEWFASPIYFKLRTPPGALVEVEYEPGTEMKVNVSSPQPLLLKVRKPSHQGSMIREGSPLPETRGYGELRYALLNCPAGDRRYRVEYKART